jgi:hypothetical protein
MTKLPNGTIRIMQTNSQTVNSYIKTPNMTNN